MVIETVRKDMDPRSLCESIYFEFRGLASAGPPKGGTPSSAGCLRPLKGGTPNGCEPICFKFQGPAWWSFIAERGRAGTTAGDKLAASRHARCERRTTSDLLCAGLMNQEYFARNQARSVANRPVFVSPVASFSRPRLARIWNLPACFEIVSSRKDFSRLYFDAAKHHEPD